MSNIKESLILSYLEENSDIAQKNGDLERADQEWKKELTCSRLPNLEDRNSIDDAAYTLAGEYEYVGLSAGFDLACQMFAEIFAAALKGGASA